MSNEPNRIREEYVEVDKNMVVNTTIDEPDIKFYDVRRAPFELYNLYDPVNQPIFRRLPEDVAEATSPGVARLCRETVGARVRFSTDSQYITIKTKQFAMGRAVHLPFLTNAGFDLYEDTETDSRFIRPFLPPVGMTDGYEQIIKLGSRKLRYFTIYFPVHSGVEELLIGLQNDAVVGPGKKYLNEKPIVVYGSSIVHGTGATRPGLVYTNLLCRRLNMDVVNLGFSGNAKGEEAIARYMATLDMDIFVSDYDHNAPNAEYLRQTHKPLYEIIREKNPDLPYIMISRPNVATRPKEANERRDVIIDTYRYARSIGDRNVYYIDGETFFLGRYENDCTVDGSHPNDLGYALMADGIEATIRRVFRDRG